MSVATQIREMRGKKFEPQKLVYKVQCRLFCKPTAVPNKSLQLKSFLARVFTHFIPEGRTDDPVKLFTRIKSLICPNNAHKLL